MTDFLLELRSEEIPARMQEKAREDLARMFGERLASLGLAHEGIESYATPRRLALIVRGLGEETAATTEERKGPRADAPAQAIEGFLRSTGLAREQLVTRDDGKGGQVLFAVIERPGLPTPSILANACAHVVHAFPWPKSMRWGEASTSTESLRWVRPLQGIVAMFGEKLVQLEVAGIKSGVTTMGHRFHHPGPITLGGASDYVEKLRACHVIVDGAERRAIIAVGAKLAAQKAGLALVEDEGLLFENAGLTEWPVPLLGRFDADFLDVPPEVIQLTARVNQKYFVCRDAEGKLANAFVCVANVDAADGGAKIVEGNRKVLAARLSDAWFFYQTDLKVPLEEQAKKLEKIVFHEKLGTVADKVERVAKLARWLVEEGIVTSKPLPFRGGVGGGAVPQAGSPADRPHPNPSPEGEGLERLADLAERAARLAKADLVTGMVGEFPELQGVMGGYYALAQGEDPAVAEAIRDHYKPVGQGDDVPTAPVTVAVSLADKLDTIVSFFTVDLRPSGSRDPFALRRAAIGIAALLASQNVALPLSQAIAPVFLEAWLFEEQDDILRMYIKLALSKGYDDALGKLVKILQTECWDYPGFESLTDYEKKRDEERFWNWITPLQSHLATTEVALLDFFADRLKVQQREAGVRHDLIDAVFALGGEDDLVRLLARVKALQAFVGTEDGANLLVGYRRAANILKKEGYTPLPSGEGGARSAEPSGRVRVSDSPDDHPHPSAASPLPPSPSGRGNYRHEPAEDALINALAMAEPMAAASVEREDFEGAMAALAQLRAPIDAFFDTVTVNDPDPAKREARLALLARMRDAVHKVADFSKIEG